MRRPIHCEGFHSPNPDGKTGEGMLNSSPRCRLLPAYEWDVISCLRLLLLPCPPYDGLSSQTEGHTKNLFLKSLLAGHFTTAAGELITQVKISHLTGLLLR